MHILKTKFSRILQITILSCFPVLQAQDLCLMTADKFYENHYYEQAITEYERFLFFNPGDEQAGIIYYKISLALRNQELWPAALKAMDKSIFNTIQDSIKDDRTIAKAVIYMVQSDFSSAEFELLRIAHFSDYTILRQKAFYFLGICYVYTARWENASAAFNNCYASSPYIKSKINSLLQPIHNLNYKSPVLAKWLSTFMPGTGQIYAGDMRNGLNALLLNSVTGYLLISSLLEKQYLDALLINITIFERYYRGNRFNAEHLAQAHNDRINRNYAKNLLDQLSKKEVFPGY